MEVETAIIVALIGAAGVILAAILPIMLQRRATAPNPLENASPKGVGPKEKPVPKKVDPLPMKGETPMPAEKLMTPDELFDKLLNERKKISYSKAYGLLIGPPPDPWRNIPNADAVARLGKTTLPRLHGDLTIKLDTLIVNKDGNREPSEKHFKDREYSREQWKAAFGDWNML